MSESAPSTWTVERDPCDDCCPITATVIPWFSITDVNGVWSDWISGAEVGGFDSYFTDDPEFGANEGKTRVQMRVTGADPGLLIVRAQLVSVVFVGFVSSYVFGADDIVFAQTEPGGPLLVGEADYYQIPQPGDTDTHTFLASIGGRAGALLIARQAAHLRKRGFPGFTGAGSIPIIYKKQTAAGGSDGCSTQGLPARDYDGAAEFTSAALTSPIPITDPAGAYEETFSDDVIDARVARPALNTPIREQPFGTVIDATADDLSSSTRDMQRSYYCNGETRLETLFLRLSEPYTTAALLAAVQDSLDQQLATPGGALPGLNDIVAAHRLTPDEIYHLRVQNQIAVNGGGPGVHVYASEGDTIALTIHYQKRLIDFATGAQTVTNETTGISIECNESSAKGALGNGTAYAETDPFSIVCADNTQVEISYITPELNRKVVGPFFLERLPFA